MVEELKKLNVQSDVKMSGTLKQQTIGEVKIHGKRKFFRREG